MINFSRAFDSAWERMVVILFRPFDLGKWFVIGFSAFLAGLLQGGNGFSSYTSGSGNNRNNDHNHAFWQAPIHGNGHEVVRTASDGSIGLPGLDLSLVQSIPNFSVPQLGTKMFTAIFTAIAGLQMGMMIFLFLFIFTIVLALVLLFYWLGARGQFLLLDNIVRNRGLIGWPWTTYSRQANSFFLAYLAFAFITFLIVVPIVAVGVIMALPFIRLHHWPHGGEWISFGGLGLVYLVLLVTVSLVFFIFREFGIPLMFRNGLMAFPAFKESIRLVGQHPGSVFVFVLLRMALALAVIILSIVACCFCCIGAIPYIGTVAILPALIYVRCFTLDCLAQFGPQYDVWTVDVPPVGPTTPSPLSPPPRLG